ncbi:MAG TPA: 3-deoxy-D-manno-octulosonic acid transferase [Nitrospirales bacterium]|nr:3-deoxy-D-manno-octulosonic acid transferase [Nitrospira sp. MA-1]HNP60146.1 3-deoxy-D-manno-octulosonic acid transferase [Nitrospirales bacterium]
MYYVMYNVLLVLAFPIIIGLLLTKKRSQRGLWCRLGAVPLELRNLQKPVIWIHAVSLGEVATIVPLLQAMKQQYPQWPLVVSTVTETGREVVIKRLEGVAVHCYAPVDYLWAIDRYIRILQPRLFILVESEFWPNLLIRLQRHQVPICLVNGRISSRSFARYRWIKSMMNEVLTCLDLALMQSEHDAERIGYLGVNPNAIHVTGNMKFDQGLEQGQSADAPLSFRSLFTCHAAEMLIVAGSTHPQEEECLLEAYRKVVVQHPQAVLVMAPRHIERVAKLEQVIRQYGLSCDRRSRLGQGPGEQAITHGPRVIVLDTRGELAFVYREACVTFVGGTLVPVGGHNLLEPAQWGRPVLFGPHVDHCRDIAGRLLEVGGGIQIQNKEDLASQLIRLIQDPSEAEAIGQRALEMVRTHRGVIARNLQWIDQLLNRKNSASLFSSIKGISSCTSQDVLR